MKINKIVIKNYKSIKYVEIKPSEKVNVFVGENSVGKSNIFNAIEWILGPTWPSFSNFQNEDYYMGDRSLPVSISLSFDDGNTLMMDSSWYDNYGNKKSGLHGKSPIYLTDDTRQKYASAFIGMERKINENPASNKWTILGRLLQEVNGYFISEESIDEKGQHTLKREKFAREMEAIRDDFLFSVKDENGKNIMKEFQTILSEETAKQLNRNPKEFTMDLNIYDPWNFYRTLPIIVHEEETGMSFRASELGMGVQASLTIAILKAYSKLKLKNQTPIFIDEPELFLHPQGRRNFYNIIRDLADSGIQVFINTHSTEFIDLYHFNEIKIVRKTKDKGTYIREANPKRFIDDYYCRYKKPTTIDDIMSIYANAFENTGDSQKSSEAIFARKIVLVEGESETLILPYFFKLLNYNYISNGITIVRCGGKSELDRFYRLYSEFGIPCYIIFDGDYQNYGKPDEESTIKKNKAILELFNYNDDFPDDMVYDNYLGFKYRLEENLGIDEIGYDRKGLKLFKRVKELINEPDNVPSWVNEVINKINQMPFEAKSVLKNKMLDDF